MCLAPGSGLPKTVEFNVPKGDGGTYYLVTGAGAGSGSYTITWKVEEQQPPPPSNRCAVVVGIADYPGSGNDLNFTDDDAREFRDMLMSQGGYAEDDILYLTDYRATRHAMKWAIVNWLDAKESASSEVVIYYSGHGDQEQDASPADEDDGIDEQLCSWDRNVSDDEFGTWLDELESVKVAVFIDCCFSGGQIKSVSDESTVRFIGADEGISAPVTDGFAKDIDAPNRIAITAADFDEPSLEMQSLGNGVFTYFLLEGLQKESTDKNGNDWVSCEEAFEYTKRKVVEFTGGSPHTPQMHDGIPGGTQPCLGGRRPRAASVGRFDGYRWDARQPDLRAACRRDTVRDGSRRLGRVRTGCGGCRAGHGCQLPRCALCGAARQSVLGTDPSRAAHRADACNHCRAWSSRAEGGLHRRRHGRGAGFRRGCRGRHSIRTEGDKAGGSHPLRDLRGHRAATQGQAWEPATGDHRHRGELPRCSRCGAACGHGRQSDSARDSRFGPHRHITGAERVRCHVDARRRWARRVADRRYLATAVGEATCGCHPV